MIKDKLHLLMAFTTIITMPAMLTYAFRVRMQGNTIPSLIVMIICCVIIVAAAIFKAMIETEICYDYQYDLDKYAKDHNIEPDVHYTNLEKPEHSYIKIETFRGKTKYYYCKYIPDDRIEPSKLMGYEKKQ